MAKIALPPRKDNEPGPSKPIVKASEKKIADVINKGGSTTKSASLEDDTIKNFNVKILGSELNSINELREKRPKSRSSKKLGISINDWIIEAIQEKIQREKVKYKE